MTIANSALLEKRPAYSEATQKARLIEMPPRTMREGNHKKTRRLKQSMELPNNAISHDCMYHIVWCSKYRRPVLTDDVAARLEELLFECAEEIDVEILRMEIKASHLKLLIACDPRLGAHKAIKKLKAKTSRVLREEFEELNTRMPSLWTNSYHLTTVGSISDDEVRSYIREQKSV